MQRTFMLKTLIISLFITFLYGFNLRAQVNVEADFSHSVDFPLIKTKFGVYETPILDIEGKLSTMPALKELDVQWFRYENGWGKNDIDFNGGQIKGTSGNLEYNREDYTRFLTAVVNSGPSLLISHSYTPDPLKPANDWKDRPSNMEVWEKINFDYAVFGKKLGLNKLYYEIWNEPDFFWFSTFDKNTYFQIYKSGALGVKRGDKDAKVGGPVTAFTNWHTDFVQYVEDNDLPFDFLSGHAYGNADGQIEAMRRALGTYDRSEIEMLMTEYASYPTEPNTAYQPGGKVEQYIAAADFFGDVKNLLTHTDLTQVYWAQWTSEMGLLTYGGKKKALYNAFKIYNELPVNRKKVTVSNGVDAMASADAHNAGIVVWSTNEASEEALTITLDNLPFPSGTVALYRIDAEHSSYLENRNRENLTQVETFTFTDNTFTWTGQIPPKAIVYLKLFDGSNQSELEKRTVATVVQTKNWYYDRGNTHYAYFNPQTWYARLGMGSGKDEAQALVGAILEDIPTKLRVNVETEGEIKIINSTALGVRVDYQDIEGKYQYSTFYHDKIYQTTDEAFPWGTKRSPDELIEVDDLSNFIIDVVAKAPEDFRGRIILSFIMQNTGKNTSANIKIEKASEEIISVEDIVTGLLYNPEKYGFKFYPNPANSVLKMEVSTTESLKLEVSINDISGNIWCKKHWNAYQPGNHLIEVPIDDLVEGLYIINVRNAHGKMHQEKFIKTFNNAQ